VTVDTIPAELRERPQWVVWKLVERAGQEKPTKEPWTVDGRRRASSTDTATWSTFESAVASLSTGDLDGIGYVFAANDPYVGVDLDDGLSEFDRAAIVLALDSYTETSLSGTGVHVILRASLNGHGRNRRGPFEVYEHGRYFVMTGDHVRGTPTTVEDRQAQLEAVLEHFLPASATAHAVRPVVPVDLDDRDLLEKALASKHARSSASSGKAAGKVGTTHSRRPTWRSHRCSRSGPDATLIGWIACSARAV
jgi:putative DNA primase/helicase